MTEGTPSWLRWARALQALAQTGLRYASSEYETERYVAIREIAAEMMAAGGGADAERMLDILAQEVGDATPKVDVRGAVFRGDEILLVREKVDEGRWTLPGGWANVGETPSQSVEREVREETGYVVRAVKLVALYDRDAQGHPPGVFHIYKAFFLCELLGGEPIDSHETEGAAFFPEDRIPPDLSLGRTTARQIARMFAHHRHPALPAEFD